MKLTTRTQKFIATVVASPILALVMVVLVGVCLLLPFAVLIWPEIMDDEVMP